MAGQLRWLLPDRTLWERLNAEMASAEGDPLRLAKLPLLDATVKEALRLQPVVPMVGRGAPAGGEDRGARTCRRGRSWPCPIYLVHRRSSLYPEPALFRPERFLDMKPAPWEWLPFGGGLRKCVGAAFAIYEMKMVLSAMLPRVEMRLASDRVRYTRRGITITPEGGLPVFVYGKRARCER